MAEPSNFSNDENRYDDLVNEVNEEIKTVLEQEQTAESNQKIPWGNFSDELQKSDIQPIIQRNETGKLELNFKTESFNEDSFQHEKVTIRGRDLEVHNAVLEKVDTQQPIQELVNREQFNKELVENVRQGNSIEIRSGNEKAYEFQVPNNPELTAKINELPNDKALQIAEKTNASIEEKLDIKAISFEQELRPNEQSQEQQLSL